MLANQAAVLPIVLLQVRRARRTEKAHHASAHISSRPFAPLIGPFAIGNPGEDSKGNGAAMT
jgi:hypothetical protein